MSAAAAVLALPSSAHAAGPLGLTCSESGGVNLCAGIAPTFDGVPLDTNVALPPGQSTNLPLVILLHGWGGQKEFGPGVADNIKPWTDRGYAVLNFTARGFNGSCGTPPARAANPSGCAQGWIKLADARYDARDSQFLAGELADEGVIDGQKIGVTGPSYAGGQSMELAALKDRVMQPDGTLKPWTSPNGTPMRIAAGAPNIPWTDLVYSLEPNGRTLDYTITPDDPNGATAQQESDLNPIGVEKQSFVSGLYAEGQATGYFAPPGADSGADLTSWFARVNLGEPPDSTAQAIETEIATHHSPYYIDHSEAPAPLFIANGFTDDLFPPDEALRFYNRTRAQYPGDPIALMFFDQGHMRGTNKPADVALYRQRVYDWFAYYVKGDHSVTPLSGVETLTQTCPSTAPSGGPYFAPTWDAVHPGEVHFASAPAQTVTSGGGDPSVARAIDPVAGGGDACASTSASDEPGTATYRLPAASGPGYTLMGSPTVTANITAQSANSDELIARLWDVVPDGSSQTLVARAIYRPDASGVHTFQLHPNGWHFAPGHVPKLELLGQDPPYARPANGAFQITVQSLDLGLPVLEPPGSVPGVGEPTVPAVFAGTRLASDVVRLGLKLRYRRAKRHGAVHQARVACRWSRVGVRLTGIGLRDVKKVQFLVGRRTVTRRSKSPFVANIKSSKLRKKHIHSRRIVARARMKDGSLRSVRRALRRCR